MTTRATARHRASVRPNTPLTALTGAVTDHVGTIGRGGVVLAMSSGLVATMGLPAQAVGRAAGPEAAAPATAPIAVQPAVAFESGLIAAPGNLQASAAPLTAPAAATVTYESKAFTAVPRAAAAGSSSGLTGVRPELSGSFGSARGSSVLSVASRYLGVPYVYGGRTPSGWDCSGATSYIYGQLGITLPRTANEQLLATKRVARSAAKPGDLVFFTSGGRAYHVGIFAGGNMMYDAQRSGKTFVKREIYSSAVVFGQVAS